MAPPLLVETPDGGSYRVHFRPLDTTASLAAEAGLAPGRALLITDEHVNGHYGAVVRSSLRRSGCRVLDIVLPPGETTKSSTCLASIYDRALTWGIDRETCVFALGGGVVGDLAGFAAATLLRGLPLVHLPTSLIAQVDSAIGGKTGINHAAGKNLIGSFYAPALVCADPSTLDTLPLRQWRSGLAEVVKHALIGSPALLERLSDEWAGVLDRTFEDRAALLQIAAGVKTTIVSADMHEHGRRTWLNFGHTTAHAIETVGGYGRFTHGEAVAVGMEVALHLSAMFGAGPATRTMLELVGGLPVTPPLDGLQTDELYAAMGTDKKNRDGRRRFVLLRGPADPYVTDQVTRHQWQAAWETTLERRTGI